MSTSPVALPTNESGQKPSFPIVAVIKTCLRVLPLKENNLRMKMRMDLSPPQGLTRVTQNLLIFYLFIFAYMSRPKHDFCLFRSHP